MANVRRTRRTVPAELLTLDTWEIPALDDLDDRQRQRFHALTKAVWHYVEGGAISAYLKENCIHREVFYRAFDRCVTPDVRGKPLGWVGLLPCIEVRPRQRSAPIEPHAGSKGGLSGVLGLFFRQNSGICEALHAYLDKNAKRKPGGEAGIRHKSVHIKFLKLCEANDPKKERWPFTSRRQGAGAIRTYVCQYLKNNYDRIVATQYGDKAATKAKSGTGRKSGLVACMPFDIVEMDEHAAGFIGSVRIKTPEGERILDAGRVTLLLLADRHKGWIMGFKVIHRGAANRGDILDVLHAAIVGEPGYAHRKTEEDLVRPLVELDPRFGRCGFNCLLLDNALIHLADEVVSRAMAACGCAVNFGPVHTPARRQLVERIFNALERAGFKRLRTTTGSGPQDPKKQNPEEEARRCTLTENEIVHLVGNLVQKHNTDIGKHNLAASAQERMASLISGEERNRYLFPFMPPPQPGEPDLSMLVIRVRVRGNERTGRRPYFSYLEADYTSPEIAKRWKLIGSWIVLHITRANIRTIRAFSNGKPLGMCTAGGRWQWSDHSIDLRRHINQLLRDGYIKNDMNGDVVADFCERLGKDVTSATKAPKAAKQSVRQLADHTISREGHLDTIRESDSPDASQAVNELLDRFNESSDAYVQWDDIGAFNGDGHGYR